jgi:hypothetical protein
MRHVALFVLLCGCRSLLGIDEAVPLPDAAPDAAMRADAGEIDAAMVTFQLRVSALIDGRSHLQLKGREASWQHLTHAAPGRYGLDAKPTMLDEVAWLPTWPDIPTSENRDCGCSSSSIQLPDALPPVAGVATVTALMARRPPSIVQQPAATNDFTLIVELNDEGFVAAEQQTVDIVVTR